MRSFLGCFGKLRVRRDFYLLKHVLEEMPKTPLPAGDGEPTGAVRIAVAENRPASSEVADWDRVCFYITPIGEDGTDRRQHADLFLNHVVEPALQEFGLNVI